VHRKAERHTDQEREREGERGRERECVWRRRSDEKEPGRTREHNAPTQKHINQAQTGQSECHVTERVCFEIASPPGIQLVAREQMRGERSRRQRRSEIKKTTHNKNNKNNRH